jgi:hypothetical protein
MMLKQNVLGLIFFKEQNAIKLVINGFAHLLDTKKMPKQPISARIEKNILKDSKTVAKKENRSFNNLIETALIAYCKGKL